MRLGSLLVFCCSLLGMYALASISNKQAPPTSTLPDSYRDHYCATDVLLNDRLINDETFRAQHEQLEQAAYNAMKQGLAKNNAPPYVLPIVFHIIHEGGTENISDALVQQALDHLNQSFANTDYYDQGTGVATEIQFCLAKRNPEGNASTGIERVESPLTNLEMDVEDDAMKDLSRYDPTQYINVWIVKEICSGVSGCGVAGYAYFPSSHGQDHDGIVVEAKWLGTSPGNSSVLTHEIGHYLGLYHTFEGACQNDDCLTDGDRVCDTPPDQSTAAVPCDASVNSCTTDTDSGFSTDQDDQFINYMDYGDWDCYSAFTAGQRDRMHFFIEGARFSLLDSDGCLDPCTIPIEVSLNSPMDSVEIGQNITYTATGSNADDYTWFVDGVEAGSGSSLTYSFTDIGFYNVEVLGGNADPNCSASASVTSTAFCPVQASFSPSSFQVTPGTVVLFTNNSTNATDYEWSVDGNSEGTGTGFFYLFEEMGAYVITLAASNNVCTDDFSVVITVDEEGAANTGLPVWPMQGGGSEGGFHILDWRANPPLNTSVTQISNEINGSTGAAFNSCGDVVFYAVHSALNTPEQLFLFASDGTALLTANTANGPGLNAVRGPTELQVVPVPGSQIEWYLIYREYSSDSGAPINNAAYKTLPLAFSRVRLELDGSITVVDRDQLIADGQGINRNYSDGIAVSRTANGDNSRHYLYAARREVNQNSLSLDRFIIDNSGIVWDANTGNVPASYWNLTHSGSAVELSPTEDRIIVCNRNQWSNYQDYILFDAQAFSNTAAQAIVLDDLIVVPDGEPQDESNVLLQPLSIDQLSFNNTYPLQFVRNMPHKMSRMEFSPNGRFLYTVGGGFQSGSSQQTTLSYLAQIDLESSPLQVRLQIETTPTAYNQSTGLACSISQCGDDWHPLTNLESSYDGNIYFAKRNDQTLYVIPDPNQFMPQKLVPGIIDLSTADEPNLDLIGNASNLPDPIDGFSYLSTAAQNVQLVVTGLDCAGECRAPFDVVLVSSDSSVVETFTIANCLDTLFLCADTSLSYRLVDPVLEIEFPNAIQSGEVVYPAGATSFSFSEPLGCPEDCDEPFVYFYGEGDLNLGGATLLSDDEHLYIGGSRDGDGLIMKLTPAGEVIWSQVLSPYVDPTFITDLKMDNDQMIIGCGYAQLGSDQQAFAFKMNPATGALIWNQTYVGGSTSTFFASDIYEGGPNNTYILLGGTNGNAPPGLGCDAAFYTLDRNTGNLTGARRHFNLGSCEGFASTVFVNGQFYATGRFNFAGGGVNRMRPAIMGIDDTGNPIWSRLYMVDINQDARLYSTDIIRDGNNFVIFVHGDDNGTAGSTNNTWLIRTNGAGGAQWVRQYTFPEPVSSREVLSVGNGYVLLVKGTQSESLYTLRTNGAGEVLWSRKLSDIRLDRNGDELVLIGNHLYMTATSSLSPDGVDKVALFRMNVETGELPEGCVDNVLFDAVFTNSPYNYDGFNSIIPYDSPFTDAGAFPVQSATIQALPESCGPACGPEICDNELDDDGDGLADCEDPDCDCEVDCETANFVQVWGTEDGDENGGSLVALPNGNLMLGGNEGGYLSLMEITPSGELVQEKRIETGASSASITDLDIDSDGMIIGAAREGSAVEEIRGVAFRYDYNNENLLWYNRTLPQRAAYSVLEAGSDGPIVFMGNHLLNPPFPGYGDDISWQSLDRNTGLPTGDISANFNLGGPETFNQSIFYEGKIFHSGRYALDFQPNTFRAGVSRFNVNGDEEWSRLLHVAQGSQSRLYARDIDEVGGELYVSASGDDSGSSNTETDLFLYKLNTEGDLLWAKKYDLSGIANEQAMEMTQVEDGFLILGVTRDADSDFFLLKVDWEGTVQWATRYQTDGEELLSFNATQQLIAVNGAVYFTGSTQNFNTAQSNDVVLIRTNEDGLLQGDCFVPVALEVIEQDLPNAQALSVNLNEYNNSQGIDLVNRNLDEEELDGIESCIVLCEELCDNEIDDDGDGFVDCEDPDLSNDCCCYTPPILDLGPDTVLCDNAVVQLDAGSGFTTYEWWDGSTEQTYTAFTAGNYYVMVTDSCGNMQSDTISVIIDPATAIDLGPDTLICVGASLTLSVSGFDTYQWFSPELVDCATCPSVVFNAGEGTYTLAVVGSTVDGCISADSLVIEVQGSGVGDYSTASLCAGENLTFGNQLITAAGEYYDTTGVDPCLSIDTLLVEILPILMTEETLSICDGHVIPVFDELIGEAGVYQDTFPASTGCDSIHTITLEVLNNITTSETINLCVGEVIDLFGEEVDSPGTYEGIFQAANGCDSTHVVTVQVLPVGNTEESLSLCQGETVLIFGQTVGTAGEYSETVPGANGCDSTHTVIVSLLPTVTTSESMAICDGESAIVFGDEINEAGTYSETFTAANGCDSTHTIELAVLPVLETSESLTICEGESIQLFGDEVSTAGQYTGSFTAVNGCDSTHQVDLEVLPNIATAESLNLCEGTSIQLFGEIVTTAGTYEATFTAANGCDSTHTVVVSILPQVMTSETISGLCPGELIEVFGQEVDAPGTYSEVYTGANGCDSTHTVTVQYEAKNIDLDVFVICEGETVDVFGQEISTPGVYTQTYTGANGCDSLVQIQVIREFFLGEVVISGPLPGQESYAATILAAGGGWPYTYQWSVTDETSETIFNLPVGEHSITVTSVHGCEYVLDFTVDDFLDLFNEPDEDIDDPFYIPNAFSPNYDGSNDYFTIYADDEVKSVRSLMVFSRWGEPLFERLDFVPNRIQLGWDGTFRGQVMEAGVYVFKAEIELVDGQIIQRAGDLVLVR